MSVHQESHNIITLHRYFNGEAIKLDRTAIASIERFSAKDDAMWDHMDPKPYTKVTMKEGSTTSDGVGSAFVSETPEEIRKLTL